MPLHRLILPGSLTTNLSPLQAQICKRIRENLSSHFSTELANIDAELSAACSNIFVFSSIRLLTGACDFCFAKTKRAGHGHGYEPFSRSWADQVMGLFAR